MKFIRIIIAVLGVCLSASVLAASCETDYTAMERYLDHDNIITNNGVEVWFFIPPAREKADNTCIIDCQDWFHYSCQWQKGQWRETIAAIKSRH